MDTERAAHALVCLFAGERSEEAYVGAELLAEALMTIRDFDRLAAPKLGFWKRQW